MRRVALYRSLFFAFVACIEYAFAFHKGDIVQMSRRGQYNELRTDWIDTFASQCPRFASDRTVFLQMPNNLANQTNFKMMFSFDNQKVQTPWILIRDEKASLNFLEFTLTYKGDEIVDLRWRTDSSSEEEHKNMKPLEKIRVLYEWTELVEEDVDNGLTFLFAVSFITTAFALFGAIRDSPAIFIQSAPIPSTLPQMPPKVVAKPQEPVAAIPELSGMVSTFGPLKSEADKQD